MAQRRLVLEMTAGERVKIDHGRIAIILEHKSGQRARIRFEADVSVEIGTPEQTEATRSARPVTAG